ncbi:LIM domain-containing protein C4F6.12 [Colletotrichum gloeosporioides]|uniref:LIM domain-containing protein C4F6.12 n=1 Tax=Colletotrichum gloeosporioides TaxID=474922 RepID=A0A8H4CJ59_COLGL|nr:LIM domain-containing protein C4F6.12 [Colletotrichum gloeosporioides]KAF3804953.1 LIM domain-containing protein C4F6.12 [Colletotrichum gloeosporioides]
MHRRRSAERTRKVTPPSPTYMNNEQFAAYLANLRTNRVARPGGARPQPPSSTARSKRPSHDQPNPSEPLSRSGSPAVSIPSSVDISARPSLPQANASFSSRYSMSSISGRDYYPPRSATPLKPSEVVPTDTYMERGQRWMEKEEAVSLRQAMDDMRIKDDNGDGACLSNVQGDATSTQDDDQRIYNAALDEASELVWQHRNGVAPPDPNAPYRYKPHLRKNSYAHARTASVGKYGNEIGPSGLARDTTRSFSGSSTDSDGRPSLSLSRDSFGREGKSPERPSMDCEISGPSGAMYSNSGVASVSRRRSSMKRNISGEVEKPFSGDQIWEEPEVNNRRGAPKPKSEAVPDLPLVDKPKNPQSQVRFAAGPPADRVAPWKPRCKVEIHRNPPSQSRNPQYTTNTSFPKPAADGTVPKKNGMEIRSDDIRGATSMKLKDRSAKLPTPTAVSDRPGRPIVSFDSNWKAPDEKTDARPGSAFGTSDTGASSQKNQPVEIPSIVVAPEDFSTDGTRRVPAVPSISIAGADEPAATNTSIPVIVTPDDDNAAGAPRPLPDPKAVPGRGRPFQRPQRHWSPAPGAGHRSTTLCHECGFPIEGRFVSLAGLTERFHPQCFSCFACGTGLEALEISPEPEAHRQNRLDRIRRRENGEMLDETPGETVAEDGDERLRFYCHLDWHELFAPRCKHCKTPILGEHVVALGEHWHYGHFFCAECGDPFEKGMTHIEKDGYAWCINCQTKRTERRAPKCKKCRCAVIGQYIRALGGEWHDECFRCAACNGGFDDGQIFPKDDGEKTIVLCTRCRMMELKA